MNHKNTIRKFIKFIPCIFVCGIGIILILELLARPSSMAGCESDYLGGYLMSALKLYASDYNGYYPVQGAELELKTEHHHIKFRAGDEKFVCPGLGRRTKYEWTTKHYKIGNNPSLMIVWDSKPHGYIWKWRNVIFVGGRFIERVPEKEFRNLKKEQETE